MGVKLKELLLLPSLREAKVVTGQNSLNKSVNSLSFLEVSDMTFFSENIQVGNEYYAGELLIGSFYNIRTDIKKQCETIRHLHSLGEIGIILYYVGIVLPELSKEVIQLAESLDFVIIQMPEKNAALRYNEVIIEIMSAVLSNRNSDNLLNEVLEKVSLLPENLRSVEISLKMLSDLLRASILLTTGDYEVVNQIMWPRNSTMDITKLLEDWRQGSEQVSHLEGAAIFHREIHSKDNELLNLFLVKENGEFTAVECEQSVEILQVALNLWGKQHGEISEYALVQAIINDESEKMYRLAGILSIDVQSIQMMWLIQLKGVQQEKRIREELEDYLSNYYQTHVIQFVDEGIIVLLGNYLHKSLELEISSEFLQNTEFKEMIGNVVVCPRMRNTTDVRAAYQLISGVKPVLPQVFPERKNFTIGEIKHIARAVKQMKRGEREIEKQLLVLEVIMENEEYLETLSTFLLDADGDFQLCSELLYIHKNTVKYRIRKISELLGYDVTRLSEAVECYFACIMYRLIY